MSHVLFVYISANCIECQTDELMKKNSFFSRTIRNNKTVEEQVHFYSLVLERMQQQKGVEVNLQHLISGTQFCGRAKAMPWNAVLMRRPPVNMAHVFCDTK